MRGWRALISDHVGAVALVGTGLAGLYQALNLTFGTVRQPGPGFYPTLVCILLIVFGGLSFGGPAPSKQAQGGDGEGHARIWMVVGALVLYLWALPRIGFVLCTAALLLLLLRRVGRVSWTASVAASAIGSVACYAIFVQLGLPLPAGLLRF